MVHVKNNNNNNNIWRKKKPCAFTLLSFYIRIECICVFSRAWFSRSLFNNNDSRNSSMIKQKKNTKNRIVTNGTITFCSFIYHCDIFKPKIIRERKSVMLVVPMKLWRVQIVADLHHVRIQQIMDAQLR